LRRSTEYAAISPLGQHVAIARDDAFVFAYPTLLSHWRCRGVTLSFFSPLADEPPDRDADAVYLPGGYPELHAERLAAAHDFLAGLRTLAETGSAIYGECGGYMVLGEELTDASGRPHRMAGLLPLTTSFAERRRQLGYRRAKLLADAAFGGKGMWFRGHEFHYASIVSEAGSTPLFTLTDAANADLGPSGSRRGSVAGSFIHLIDCEN
jgi:cobyrinic acid a,c-diamide synthase